jgi:hypothetical protein
MRNSSASQALFESVGRDGTDWLFVVRSDEQWGITRDGMEVGTGDQKSVAAGIKQFMMLVRAVVGAGPTCSAAVSRQLDRIERGKIAASSIDSRRLNGALQCVHV